MLISNFINIWVFTIFVQAIGITTNMLKLIVVLLPEKHSQLFKMNLKLMYTE
jgi:hypothetical protein